MVSITYFGGQVRRVSLASHEDERGSLLPISFKDLPFQPCRVFVVHGVPPGTERGRHGHQEGQQCLVCVSGRITVEMRLGGISEHCVLEPGSGGLLIGPGVWAKQTYVEEHSILLVLASHPYNPDALITES
jgi:dTDP-4-dehydrorhamnose 3,5-epimerase-like enzyme